MRREIDWPNGEKLVFQDMGNEALQISVQSVDGTHRSMIRLDHDDVDELEKAIMEWRLCPQDGRTSWSEEPKEMKIEMKGIEIDLEEDEES